MAIIAVGYRAPEQVADALSATPAPVSNVTTTSALFGKIVDNDVVSTEVAASVAAATDLAIAPNVAELAVSVRVQSQFSASDETGSITKPIIVQLSDASRNIAPYTVLEGDTVPSVAAKFNVSTDTIKWANNLTSDSLVVGTSLDILPRNGIAYTIKDGDTIEKLAEKYKGNVALITTYNDLEINGVTTGLKIVIPEGVLPTEERPGYRAPVTTYSSGSFIVGYGAWAGQVLNQQYRFTGSEGGYAPGNCTAWAYLRRAQMGRPVPSDLGNAYTWATVASRKPGFVVNSTPGVGAVIQSGNHVGIVEEIYANGDLRITDMNYGYRLHNLAERIIPAGTTGNYRYIH